MTPEDRKILARHGITPDNLAVRWSLDLSDTAITALPDNLTVVYWICLSGTAITALYEDERGYRLDRAGDRYIAGCRNFTAAEAIAHWGSDGYPEPERGRKFVEAVKAEEKRRQEARQ